MWGFAQHPLELPCWRNVSCIWPLPWRKNTGIMFYWLLTYVLFLSPFPLAQMEIESECMGGKSISTSTSGGFICTAWAPNTMLLFAVHRELGSVREKKFSRLQKDELHSRHGSSSEVMNQTLVCAVLFYPMQQSSDLPMILFLEKSA